MGATWDNTVFKLAHINKYHTATLLHLPPFAREGGINNEAVCMLYVNNIKILISQGDIDITLTTSQPSPAQSAESSARRAARPARLRH